MGMGVVSTKGKKKHLLRSLFCRLRASLKKAAKSGTREKITFHYDPSSYALNFDDGIGNGIGGPCSLPSYKLATMPQHCSDTKEIQWVYVLWVKYE